MTSVRIGQVYEEHGYNRHFKVRAVEETKAVVSSCMRDGADFNHEGSRTRIRLDRLGRSPYRLVIDSGAVTCPTCGGSGSITATDAMSADHE